MAHRARDWMAQAERDFQWAQESACSGYHEWACFAARQAAEKAVNALHLHFGQEAWGHALARLLRELPSAVSVAPDLIEKARALDACYIPPRDPNSHPEGAPFKARRRWPMPVRSLRSPVLRWPDAGAVLGALREWAQRRGGERAELLRVGCFGSYARGDWGVGSDLDVVLLVREAVESFP